MPASAAQGCKQCKLLESVGICLEIEAPLMGGNRVGRDAQFIGNLLDAHSLCEQVKDFTLPGSEPYGWTAPLLSLSPVQEDTAQIVDTQLERDRGNLP